MQYSNKIEYTRFIKDESKRLGFSFCGISKVEYLEQEAPRLEQWLKNGMQGNMSYMANYFDKRLNPALLVEGAKSVVSLLLNYYPAQEQNKDAPKVSKYAYGKDYHFVIKDKLKELLYSIRQHVGDVNGRAFVDSAPVLDRVWAKKSGLGWIGKNANLINKQHGSFFFIAELIIDLDLEYDGPVKDYCGTCTKCIDSCPTQAIVEPFVVDGSKCISYFTIELKENIPLEFSGKFNDWVFGCDICQDVCPWNRFSQPHNEQAFVANDELIKMNRHQWEEITEEVFDKLFKYSPLKRTKFQGLKRNLEFLRLK